MAKGAMEEADELHRLGLQAGREGRFEAALELLTRATRLAPNHAAAHCTRGRALQSLQRPESALASFDRAIAADPAHVEAHFHRGALLGEWQRWPEALASYDRTIELHPDHAASLCNRGVVCERLGRWREALADYDRAIAVAPDLAIAHSNRGNVLKELRQPEAAVASCDRAIQLQPGLVDAHFNRAVALAATRRLDAALAGYERAIRLSPGHIGAHFGRATTLLLCGRYEIGLAEYEWRWPYQRQRYGRVPLQHSQPPWLGGESLEGRTILLTCEQGLGDTLQFCRYAKRVAQLGATVILQVQRRLVATLSTLDGVSMLVSEENSPPPYDRHCSLLSLPLALKTTAASIPADIPYLGADAGKAAGWRARLEPLRRLRVGLAWRGNPQHPEDRNRSIDLAEFIRHLPVGCDYVSLQLGLDGADRELLRGMPGVLDVEDAQSDFSDTAALCANLDLVVSVDTSVAHLAGALGRPTWILLPFVPDWRWGLEGEQSAWYPTVRLYRQSALDDWRGVLTRVASDLCALAARAEASAGWSD